MSKKLNQVLAIEKNVKSRVYQMITDLHKVSQKSELLNGFSKTYEATEEGGQVIPPQAQRVQYNAREIFEQAKKGLAELFDVTATKDWGNQDARADVEVDGQTILNNVPATYLLFLDKQLSDMRTFVDKFSELDPSVDWEVDPTNSQLYKSPATMTVRTEKVQKPIVLYQATDKHPAQTQLVTQDITVGKWNTIRFSGALPANRKREIMERVERLSQAVKEALERANMQEVESRRTGDRILGYLFG